MKNALAVIVLALCSVVCRAVDLSWPVDQTRIAPYNIEAYHGETLNLSADMGAARGASSATFLWQTNGMGSAWWQTNAVVTSDGRVTARFTPSMDTGADRVKFFFSVVSGSGTSYRASGTITMRPSPGSNPSVAVLPPPGGHIDFAFVNVLNAPGASVSDVDAALSAATNAIVIPPAPDLSGYATAQGVTDAITAATNAIVIPPAPSLEPYCTIEAARQMVSTASNELATAISGIQIPSLSGYATMAYVDGRLDDIPVPDLSPYATKSYADEAASNAVAGVQVPSLEGYATRTYVDTKISEVPTLDLSPYATKNYADTVASNAVASVHVPSLDGYATEKYVQDAVSGGLVRQVRSTALETIDGNIWQDATGVVWRASMNHAWVGTNGAVYVDDGSGNRFVASDQTVIYWSGDTWNMKDNTYDVGADYHGQDLGRDARTLTWTRQPWSTFWGEYHWQTNRAAGFSTNAINRVAYTNDIISAAATNEFSSAGVDTNAVLGLIAAATNAITPQSIGAQERFGEDPPGFLDAGVRYAYAAGIAYSDGQNRPIEDTYAEKYEVEDLHAQVNSLGDHYNEILGTVSAWQTYWDGDDVRVTVTNYYGNLDHPSLYLEQKMPADADHSASWFKTIWDERTRWNAFLAGYASLTNHVNQNLADRAWGVYDSSTGEYSPDGLLQLSHEQILIGGGMAYQKTVTSGGSAYWVLTANGPTTLSGQTETGYFRIQDADGNALFEIVKGDKRIVGATATAIKATGNGVTIHYNSVSSEPPALEWCDDLRTADWQPVTARSGGGASPPPDQPMASWSGESGAWVADVTFGEAPRAAFFKASYEAGGNTYIRNNVASSLDKVVVGGIEYTVTVETVNGKKLLVLQ